MHTILFDDHFAPRFRPLTLTRPIGDLRIGINTIAEQWEDILSSKVGFLTNTALQELFSLNASAENLLINARVLPNFRLRKTLNDLEADQCLVHGDTIIAIRLSKEELQSWSPADGVPPSHSAIAIEEGIEIIEQIPDLFAKNHIAIQEDFKRATYGRVSAALDPTSMIIGDPALVFIEEGATVEGAWLNTTDGPIYIGADAHVMEGSVLRGPIALCDHATVKAGSKIYGATTIGPWCKVGGEISNSIFHSYSNKGHDGFVGNSVIGQWCNFGADTNTSNLKNNYGPVKVWNYANKQFETTGLTFCGLIMGDHSKCGINTMFNTGTVVGVSANIYGGDFPPKFIPSFSWGGSDGFQTYDFDKAMETATRMMARRKIDLTPEDVTLLRSIFDNSATFRG